MRKQQDVASEML